MDNTERDERNARRRLDPNRALEFVMLPLSTLRDMVEASPRQCQDCAGMLLYLAEHPQMGDFIPEAAGWGKDKCARTLRIHGRIAADCALFCRKNGGIRCTAWPLDEVAQVLEKRKTYSNNRKGKTGGGVQSIDCSIDGQRIEEEERETIEKELPPSYSPRTACTAPNTSRPRNREEVAELFAWRFRVGGIEDGDYLHKCIDSFIESKEEAGWLDTQGQPIQNWRHLARSYADECVKLCKDCGNGHEKSARGSV